MKRNIVLVLGLVCWMQAAMASVADTTRAVAVQGATNFRDLGGYTTRQGTKVKWGKLFRSGELSKLTDKDTALLVKNHITYVVDFRGNDEAAAAKDRLPAKVTYLLLPAGSENLGNWMVQLGKLQTADSLMESFYSRTDHLKAKYKPFFQALLKQKDTDALLFHCTAGKDRTGVGAALLLYALGVPNETIMDDYLLSNVFRKEENEKMVQGMVKMGVKEQVAKDMVAVKTNYLAATYQSIVAEYGNIDNFLKTEMGLESADIALLRKKYTN